MSPCWCALMLFSVVLSRGCVRCKAPRALRVLWSVERNEIMPVAGDFEAVSAGRLVFGVQVEIRKAPPIAVKLPRAFWVFQSALFITRRFHSACFWVSPFAPMHCGAT